MALADRRIDPLPRGAKELAPRRKATRYCKRCGARLNRYNQGTLCGPCRYTEHVTFLWRP